MAFLAALGGIGAGFGASAAGIGATTAAGIGLGTASILGQGISSYQQAQYNAQVAEQKAEQAQRAQAYNERIQQRQFDRLLGANRARAAASGIEFTGSPLDVEIANLYDFELDRLNQRYNTQVRVGQLQSQAEMQRYYGEADLFNSLLGAGSFAATNTSLLGSSGYSTGGSATAIKR